MTEALNKDNKNNKKYSIKLGFIAILSLIIAGYFAFQYILTLTANSEKKAENGKLIAISNNKHTLNDKKSADYGTYDTKDSQNSNGSEFIYKVLLKNQQQISKLETELAQLEKKLAKNNNQKRIGRIILLYTKLRHDIFNGEFDKLTAQNIKILSHFDKKLQKNFTKLQNLLPDFQNQQKLEKSFSDLIPKLIIAKNHNPNGNLLTKIRENISSLVIIRRIDGKNDEEIDNQIANIEKLLAKENYQTALEKINNIEEAYQEILSDFIADLNIALEVQKIDQEILDYLQNLT